MPATLPRRSPLASPVGRKVLTGVTGVLLFVYLLQHLYANLHVFSADPQAVSRYALALEGFGPVLRLVEGALAALFAVHIALGLSIWARARRARGTGYAQYRPRGGTRLGTLASRTMIASGLLLAGFLVVHVAYFRFGPGVAEGYVTYVDGEAVRHFERLVRERFAAPGYVALYVAALGALALHLTHGLWSALQSLGLVHDRNRRLVVRLGVAAAVLLCAAFMAIPLGVYFGGA